MRSRLLPLLALLLLLASCEQITYVDPDKRADERATTYTVAVILPLQEQAYKVRWERTAQWALENIGQAQHDIDDRIKLNIEWIEEKNDSDSYYLDNVASQLAQREDVKVVIGPRFSSHVDIVAKQLARKKKLMISPTATSAELLRKYSSKGFFWALCEPDITQCEVLLTKAQGYGAHNVALIASSSIYGQTFIDWFAFQAEEMGMDAIGLFAPAEVGKALTSGADYLICVPDSPDEAIDWLQQAQAADAGKRPKLLFSDMALDPMLLSHGDLVEHVEGVTPYADPASGFEIAYSMRFHTTPAKEEVQLYDALILAALTLQEYNNRKLDGVAFDDENVALNDILCHLMATEGPDGTPLPRITAWNYDGLHLVMSQPGRYNISGATGTIDFDTSIQSPVTSSVYCHWMVYEGQFLSLDFLSSDGSKQTSSTTAAWEWHASVLQDLPDINIPIDYAPLESQWAVLVCGSRGWFNYRHQADVLHMYRLLRTNGFDDDHIILAAAPQDILDDDRNLHPDTIYYTPGGQNLGEDICLDYNTDTLTAADIGCILRGEGSSHLPTVLHTDEHSNVLFYWSGHGEFGKFLWGHTTAPFTAHMLRTTVNDMHRRGRYRKMLLCSEPCYSGSVLNAVEGIPGVLAFASANTRESSFADIYDPAMGVWLSDRFSNNLIREMEEKPDQSFRNLYLNLVHHTYGSHVTIVNYAQFDNLYRSYPQEFVLRQAQEPSLRPHASAGEGW